MISKSTYEPTREQSQLTFLATTYFGSMAWALGGGGWAIAGATVAGLVLTAGYFSRSSTSSPLRPLETSQENVSETPTEQWLDTKGDDALLERLSLDDLDRKIARTASLADSQETVMSLFAFRKEYQRLSSCRLDADLNSEFDVIAAGHFQALLDDYSGTRQQCSGDAATTADDTLRSAAVRLTASLREISEQQNSRNLGALSTTGNYIRGRHPLRDDEPF